jgi:hypothetical protein
MTSSQHGSYILGDTHATMDATTGVRSRKAERIPAKASSVQIGVCNPTP